MDTKTVCVSMNACEIAQKDESRREIERLTAEFLKRGKKVKEVDAGGKIKTLVTGAAINGARSRSRIRRKKFNLAYLDELRQANPELTVDASVVCKLTGLSKSAIAFWASSTDATETVKPITLCRPHYWRLKELIQWMDHAIATAKG